MEERSIFLEMIVDLACIIEQNWRENIVEPDKREAWSRASALIIAMWGRFELNRNVSDRVNCREFSTRENREFTKVLTGGMEARLWSKDGGQKDIDPETQSINRL